MKIVPYFFRSLFDFLFEKNRREDIFKQFLYKLLFKKKNVSINLKILSSI